MHRYFPILEMHPDAIGGWVNALTGHTPEEFLVFDLEADRLDEWRQSMLADEQNMEPVDLVRSFDLSVSPAARDLARDLASSRANRFPLWLIGLLREQFQPKTDLSIIAELCTSPIMIRIVKTDKHGSPSAIAQDEDVVYRFAGRDNGEEVRTELLRDQGKRRSEHISAYIRNYIEHGEESQNALPLHLCTAEGYGTKVYEDAQPLFVLEGDPVFPWFAADDVQNWKRLLEGITDLESQFTGRTEQAIYPLISYSAKRKVLSQLNAIMSRVDLPEQLTTDQRQDIQVELPRLLIPSLYGSTSPTSPSEEGQRYWNLRLNRLILERLFQDCLEQSEPLVLFAEENSNISGLRRVAVEFERRARCVLVFDSHTSAAVHGHFNDVVVGASRREVEPDIAIAFPSFFFQIEATGFRREEPPVPYLATHFEEFLKDQLVMYRAPGEGDDHVMGVPFTATTMVLAYNRSMFEDEPARTIFKKQFGKELEQPSEILTSAKPQEAWDWILRTARFFKEHADELRFSLPNLQCGIALNGKRGAPIFYEWSALLCGYSAAIAERARGTDELDREKGAVLTSPEVISATKFYLGLYQYAQEEEQLRETDPETQVDLLAGGHAPLGIVWSGFLPSLHTRNPSFGYTALPGNHSVVSGSTLVINRNSRRSDLACAFRDWVSYQETHRRLALNGFNTPMTNLFRDSEFRQRWGYAKAVQISLERGGCSLEATRVSRDVTDSVCDALLASVHDLDSLPMHMRTAQLRILNARKRLA